MAIEGPNSMDRYYTNTDFQGIYTLIENPLLAFTGIVDKKKLLKKSVHILSSIR